MSVTEYGLKLIANKQIAQFTEQAKNFQVLLQAQQAFIWLKGEIMDGYKIVYKEPDSTITDTFFNEPMLNFSLPKLSNMEVIKLMFGNAHPGCDIISIERCSLKEFMK